jgi:hypothetical protein
VGLIGSLELASQNGRDRIFGKGERTDQRGIGHRELGQLGAGNANGVAASSYYDLIAPHRDSEFGAGHGWQRLSGRLDGKGEWAGGAHSHSWSQ